MTGRTAGRSSRARGRCDTSRGEFGLVSRQHGMVIGYRASRRCRLVARPHAARSSSMYQITQLTGKNSPLSHAKRQRWSRRRAPHAVSEPTANQAAADRPSAQMPAALTPQHYRARAGCAARNIRVNPLRPAARLRPLICALTWPNSGRRKPGRPVQVPQDVPGAETGAEPQPRRRSQPGRRLRASQRLRMLPGPTQLPPPLVKSTIIGQQGVIQARHRPDDRVGEVIDLVCARAPRNAASAEKDHSLLSDDERELRQDAQSAVILGVALRA